MQEKYDCKRRMKEFSIDVVSSYVLILRTILYCFLCVKSSFKASSKGVAKLEMSKQHEKKYQLGKIELHKKNSKLYNFRTASIKLNSTVHLKNRTNFTTC